MALKRIASVALAGTLALTLAACGSGNIGGASSSSGDDSTLTVWHAFAGQADKVEFIDWALDEFQKEHPDIELDVTALEQSAYKTKLQSTMATNGAVPDVFYTLPGGYLKTFVDAGRVGDLTDVLNKDGWIDDFIPASLPSVTFDEHIYAVPQSIDATAFWYNKALFEEHGWSIPKTWDEFIALRDTIKAAGIVPVALGNKASWPATFWFQYLMLRQNGSGAIDTLLGGQADDTFTAKAEKAYAELGKLAADGTFPTGFNGMTDQEANLLFLDGTAAMVLNGTWQLGMTSDAPEGFEMGYFPFPETGGEGDASDIIAGVTSTFAVSADAVKDPDAITFLKFLSSKKVSEKFATIRQALSAVEGATNDKTVEPLLAGLQDDVVTPAAHHDPFYDTAMAPKGMQAYYTSLQGALDGNVAPADAAAALTEALSKGD